MAQNRRRESEYDGKWCCTGRRRNYLYRERGNQPLEDAARPRVALYLRSHRVTETGEAFQ